MMFLLAANRMSRGFARLRQWLIMAFRMAAIAGLIFAISRPLAGGWLGLTAGGRPDTTIVLLDRSPSMQESSQGGGGSKRETGLRQLVPTLKTVGSARWILIESTTGKPRELESIDDLLTSPSTGPASASADIPGMLLAAREYIMANKSGRTEIWICSDIRQNDWNAESGRWQAMREGFSELAQSVRFHLLAYPQSDPGNVSVRVTDVRRQKTADGAELLVSLRLSRGKSEGKETIPVQLEIDGARSEVAVEMVGGQSELLDHRIPLEKGRLRGWGRVSIPADSNLSDNDFYFTWEEQAARRTIVVSDDPQADRPLSLAASISPIPSVRDSAELVAPAQVAGIDWDQVSLLIWHAPLPEADLARSVQAFVERGGSAVFFPPRAPGQTECFGVRWTAWTEQRSESPVDTWRGDEDLAGAHPSSAPLPVGQLQVRRYCGLSGELTPLATLSGGVPLLGTGGDRSRGGLFLCDHAGTRRFVAGDQRGRVLRDGPARTGGRAAASLGSTRQLTAGEGLRDDPLSWKRVAGGEEAISTDFPYHRGVYQSGERLLAVNRSAAEEQRAVLADARVPDLFRGLDFARVDDRAGNLASLIQEIWRLFLVAMMTAMVVEALLCMPKPARPRPAGAVP